MDINKLNLIELSKTEIQLINGGESGWYWIAYAVGSICHAAQNIQPQVYQRW